MFKNFKLSLFLALKTMLRGDKGSLILTVMIMMVVFLNLLFIDSIFAGIGKTMDNTKINYQYGEVIIEPSATEDYIKDTKRIIDAIRDYDYVRAVTARLESGAVLTYDKEKDGRNMETFTSGVMGIDPEKDNFAMDVRSKIIDGRYLNPSDRQEVLLGADVAGGYGSTVYPTSLNGVRVGDKITASYNNGVTKEYKVVGIFKTKNFDMDGRMFVTQKELNSVLGTTNEASKIIIRLTDRQFSQKMLADLRQLGFGKYDLFDWDDKLAFGRSINKSFDMIGMILRVIGSLVAGLVIFIIIFVDIVNRRKQIGILKAIGIPTVVIKNSYIIRGMFYTVVGMTLGYLLMQFGVIGFFQGHPIDFPMGDMVPFIKKESLRMSIGLFIMAGFIGSFLPAVKEVRRKILILMR